MSKRLLTLFVSHGSPMFALEPGSTFLAMDAFALDAVGAVLAS